jgi:hypothetical protein
MNDAANKPVIRPALIGAGPSPTVAAGASGAQLGTGPAASVGAGTSMACEVTLTTGSGPTAFVGSTAVTVFTLTAPTGLFQAAPFCSIEPSNQAAMLLETGGLTGGTQALGFYYDRAASSATSLVFKAVSQGTPTLGASTAYKFEVWING